MDIFYLHDQPMTCPKCGARTEFTENPDGSQTHTCPRTTCGYVFRAESEEDDPDDADPEDA